MNPEQFFTLSNATSIAGAAAFVLVVTNFLGMFYEKFGWLFAAQFREFAGMGVAGIVTGLAMWVSPPSSGGLPAGIFLWFAITSLLYVTAFGGSKLSAAGVGEAGSKVLHDERTTLVLGGSESSYIKKIARFWRPW